MHAGRNTCGTDFIEDSTTFRTANFWPFESVCPFSCDFKSALKPLLLFENQLIEAPQNGILFNFESYLELIDWTGRVIRSDKRGYIDKGFPPILARLDISPNQ